MIQVIDTLAIFILSFLIFFITYSFLNRSQKSESNREKIEKKIMALAKRQDELLESSSERISTFTSVENTEFGSLMDTGGGVIGRIKVVMKKAGITNISTYNFIILCFIGGCVFATIITHFNFLNALTGIPIGMCIGAFLVYNFLASMAAKRRMQFLQLFPDAIDMMIRGVKAGLNVGRIMKLVSMESKEPVSGEFRIISQKFDLGVEPEKVLVDAAERVDIEEFRFLVVALVLQMENGGVLAEILQNLAGIVRKRLELGLKLKAMSAEARMSAIVISVLPFVFAGIMALVNPNHLKEFVTPGSGQTLLKVAVTLFSVGTFMMLKATKIKV
ncbi:MAG: type II secretion system F family protein [Holosporaceae bacterium]|jgi:tight adherence protein B|nr:type II secretion system F family protein [Holosporaceae bacterium]